MVHLVVQGGVARFSPFVVKKPEECTNLLVNLLSAPGNDRILVL